MACPLGIVAVAVVAVSMAMCFASADPDVSVEDVGCTNHTYEPRDIAYYPSVEHVLDTMAMVTANHPGYNIYTSAPYPLSDIVVHANCNLTLSVMDCTTCLSTATTKMKIKCAGKLAARMQLKDCYMVYGPIWNISSKRTW